MPEVRARAPFVIVLARRMCQFRTPSLHSNEKLEKCNICGRDCRFKCRCSVRKRLSFRNGSTITVASTTQRSLGPKLQLGPHIREAPPRLLRMTRQELTPSVTPPKAELRGDRRSQAGAWERENSSRKLTIFAVSRKCEGLMTVDYQHTQKAPLIWLLQLPIIALLAFAWVCRSEPVLVLILASVAVLLFLVSLCFGYMTVRDEGDKLAVRYGPLPLFRTHVAYAWISSAERGRSSILDGWGIHWLPGRGFTYNLWGFDCVRLVVRGKTVRVGSDDVDDLVDFLNSRIEQ